MSQPNEIYGYRAELVLYDDEGNRLFITNALEPAYSHGAPNGDLKVNWRRIDTAIDQASATNEFDRIRTAIHGRNWRVEMKGAKR